MRLIDADKLKQDDEVTLWLSNDAIRAGKTMKMLSALFVERIDNAPTVEFVPVDTLNKIKAEILEEANMAYADFERYKVDYLGADAEYVEDELPQDDFRYGMERAIEIIDKYKAKSEEE